MDNSKIRFSVKTKLISSFLAIAILSLIVCGSLVFSLNRVSHSYSKLVNVNVNVLSNAKEMQYYADHQVSLLREYFLFQASDDKKGIDQDNKSLSDLIQSTLKMDISNQSKTSITNISNLDQQFVKEANTLLSMHDEKAALQQANKENLFESGVKIMDEAQAVVDEQQKIINQSDSKNASQSNFFIIFSIILTIIVFIVSIVIGLVMSSKITSPLRKTVELMEKVAAGDLRNKLDIHTKDEIGQLANAANGMVTRLRDLISNIMETAQNVAASSQQISASTEEIASGSTDQANSAQTMSELFKELSAAINSVAESAEAASGLSSETNQVALDGGKVVEASIQGIGQVNEQMSRLETDSNQIGEIIGVIEEIAEQTNLLALNAAIEAARAGEQGRGFAVVADEVRKLAERSGDATKQITNIIKGMQNNTGTSVKFVSEAVEKTKQIGEAFERIIQMVGDSSTKANEIAAASEEQAAQSNEVMGSIETISAASEEASSAAEETASTSQTLAELAEGLNQSISFFKVKED